MLLRGLFSIGLLSITVSAAAQDAGVPVPTLWPDTFVLQSGPETAAAAAMSMPLPKDADPAFTDALRKGALRFNGNVVQAQTVAFYPGDGRRPRRMILRWLPGQAGSQTGFAPNPSPAPDAGWSFAYKLVEGNEGDRNWVIGVKDIPLDLTEYEMYQLDLKHGDRTFGIRLGLRTDKRVYWWQFIRADFVERGPVCDILRVGGPIYQEQYTVQGDLYLVLYANGVVEVYPHFISHMREGASMDVNGVPVVAFDVPGKPQVEHVLDGTQPRFNLGECKLDLDYTVHMADKERQGSLKTEGDVVVLQPWLDQQIYGGMLVYDEGVPEHRIIRKSGTTAEIAQKSKLGEADQYYVTTVGDKLIPKGVARSFRVLFALPGVEPAVVRYQAPGWWHAMAGALPTGGKLPTSWRAVPHALKTAEGYVVSPSAPVGPYEYGRGGADGDGTMGASMLLLGQATGTMSLCADALPACYWRADIPIHHDDFTISEVPFFGWQWIVQPYTRFMSAIPGYWETGDPYLLETAELAADGYYRFFMTNRPHRFVGRDILPVEDMLTLYLTTGDDLYLKRIRRILEEARKSYGQTDDYWPGHQSGAGPNGVARRPNHRYTPALMAYMQVAAVEETGDRIPAAEREACMEFADFAVGLIGSKPAVPGDDEWGTYAVSLLYGAVPGIAERFPDRAVRLMDLFLKYQDQCGMPESHSGGRAYSWIVGAVRIDAWAWGAEWKDGTLHLRPQRRLLDDPKAPRTAIVHTPKGPVRVEYADGQVKSLKPAGFPLQVEWP